MVVAVGVPGAVLEVVCVALRRRRAALGEDFSKEDFRSKSLVEERSQTARDNKCHNEGRL